MEWTQRGREFEKIAQVIVEYVGEYYVWGTGISANVVFNRYNEFIQIKSFVESEKTKEVYCGKPVIQLKDIEEKRGKFVIASKYYEEIKKKLIENGYIENVDFFHWTLFQGVYDLYVRNQLLLNRVDISITSRCTLKCQNCNMFMPYYKKTDDLGLAEIQSSVDILFKKIDYVNMLNLLGGEPFLHKELYDIIDYIFTKYQKQFGSMEIFTNGMILPSVDLLKLFKKNNIKIQLSDYTKVVDYRVTLNSFIEKLEKFGVSYSYYKLEQWLDFGFPKDPDNIVGKINLKKKFSLCKAPFRGLVGNKLYYCHLNASAEFAGIYKGEETDYIRLDDDLVSRAEILEFDLGYNDEGFLSFCRVCRGCEFVNDRYVEAAIQLEG